MWLRRIEVDRLRNLTAVDLELDAGLTVIQGDNGQGKTSVLEAIYLLATGRSFRTRRVQDLVAWNAGGATRVYGETDSKTGGNKLSVVLLEGERKLLVEGGENDLESYLGRLDVVDLTAGRMDVLKGGPEERRRFLDRGIVGLDPAYLRSLGEYRRVVAQRNALLRAMGGRADGDRLRELTVWDGRLVEAGARVHRQRREYAVTLAARLGETGRVLAPEGMEFRFRYRPSPSSTGEADPGRFEELTHEALERDRGRDLGLGFTSAGPHRDDALVELNETDLRRFGSAGQLRAALIALKLAKLGHLGEQRGESPVFLLDDFDTDLDEGRAARLGAYLGEGGFQTVVATSKETLAQSLGLPCKRVRMERGAAAAL